MTDLAIVDPVVRATDEDCEGRDESQQAEANELFFDGTKALEFLTHVYWTSFMTTLVVTAALTFTSPKFSATTDVILRFYGTFNPCIFFDHYPASVLGLLGLTVMDIAGTLWAIFFLLSIAARTDVISTFTYSIPIFVHIGTQLTFSNVFVTDMYAHGYTTAPGPNKSAALTQRNASYLERMNFTAYQRDMVEAHSLWYVVWLFGEALMLVVVCSLVSPRKCGCCCKIFEVETGNFFWAFFMLLAFFGSTVTGAQMLVNFYQYSDLAPVDLRHIPDHEKTWVQRILFGINMAIQQEAWHFFPMLAWRFFRPANFGFHATIRMRSPTRNERNTHEWSKMQPERFISAAFGIIGLSTLGTYLFKDPTVNEAQVKIPLGSGFRQQPYAFLFVPLFTFTIVLIILGVGLAWYRERLMRQSPLASLVCGLLWIAAMIACILIVLPQFDQTGLLVIGIFVTIPVYMFVTYTPLHTIFKRGLAHYIQHAAAETVWCLAWGACAATSYLSALPNLVMILLLCFAGYFGDEDLHLPIYVGLVPSGRSYLDEDLDEEEEEGGGEENTV